VWKKTSREAMGSVLAQVLPDYHYTDVHSVIIRTPPEAKIKENHF
jgi:hypothetical protein